MKQELIRLKLASLIEAHPNFPVQDIPKPNYTDKTANGLTKMIIDWLNLNGHQAERISTTGRYINNSKVVKDVMGGLRQVGTGKYIKGSGTKGSADISCTIDGRSVKVEVKIGRDKQSDHQKDYQAAIERAGGIYYIAKDFDSFYKWYVENFNK